MFLQALQHRKRYFRGMTETLMLAWPVILGQLGHMIIGQADTIMIGRLGKIELAAATLANSIFFLPFVIGMGICMAISPLVAQAVGAKREDELRQLLNQGFWVAIWSGLLFVAVTFGMAELIPYFGQDPAVVPLAQEYMRIIGLSSLPMLLFLALKHYADGFEDVLPGMVIMGFVVAFNLLFNYLLIEGHWGFPRLELTGAGWATFMSRSVGFLIVFAYIFLARRYKKYRRAFSFKHHLPSIRRILKIGLPSGFQYLFEVGSFTGAVILIGRLGPEVQSAHHIALGIPAIIYMAYMGIASAGSIRVGNALGRKDHEAIRTAGVAAWMAATIFIVIGVIGMLGFNEVLPQLYIQDSQVQAIAANLILIAALFQIGDGIQAVSLGLLRGIEDVKMPTLFTFIAYWIIGLPVGWLFLDGLSWGVEGMWYGLTIGLAFSALFLTIRFVRLTRKSSI